MVMIFVALLKKDRYCNFLNVLLFSIQMSDFFFFKGIILYIKENEHIFLMTSCL